MKIKIFMMVGLVLLTALQPTGWIAEGSSAFPKTVKGSESIIIDESSYFVVVSRSTNNYSKQTINLTYENGSFPIYINEFITMQLLGPHNITIDFPDNATYLIADDFIMNCYWTNYSHYSATITEPVAIILDLEEIDYEGDYDTCDVEIDGNVNGYLYDEYLNLNDTGKQFSLQATLENPLWANIIVVEPLESSVYVEINATATNSRKSSAQNLIITPIAGLAILILLPIFVLYFAVLGNRRRKRTRPPRHSKK